MQWLLEFVPDYLKTEEMCEKTVDKKPLSSKFVPDGHKTQGMCNEVVQKGSYLVKYVFHWFVLREQLKILDDYKGFRNNSFYDSLNKWDDGYQKHKDQKAKIKEELLSVADTLIVQWIGTFQKIKRCIGSNR